MKRNWLPFALLATVLAAAPLHAAEADDRDERDDRAEDALRSLLAAEDALQADALARGAAPAFTEVLDDEVSFEVVFQPLLQGRAAVTTWLQATYPDATTRLTLQRNRGDVAGAGDLGFTFGWYTRTGSDGTPHAGDYMAMWHRGHDRRWHLLSWLATGAAPRTPPPAWFVQQPAEENGDRVNRARATSALELLDTEFAALSVAQGQSVAHRYYAAADAAESATGDWVYGRDAIVASHQGEPATLNWAPTGGGVSRSGDLGYTIGHYVYTLQIPGTPEVQYPGHYLTIWKRQPDGQWKWQVGSGAYSPVQ
jgi:ketosteroid isomerase-like protein